ncbi:hypothetical protein GCM10009549_49120 [Streptomyces thermoalcalitolerans]|uniref:Uncharacterized protein n=1 Tax=Streptomyces thermoalcalitolerans TaxID=65605 RepID=A0ABP3ZVS6_9ACTN
MKVLGIRTVGMAQQLGERCKDFASAVVRDIDGSALQPARTPVFLAFRMDSRRLTACGVSGVPVAAQVVRASTQGAAALYRYSWLATSQ